MKREKRQKKVRFSSICVSFLLRDHANLLCILKRLFDVRQGVPDNIIENFKVYKAFQMRAKPGPFMFLALFVFV